MNECITNCVSCIKKFKEIGEIKSLEGKLILVEIDSSLNYEQLEEISDELSKFAKREFEKTVFIISTDVINDLRVLSDEDLARIGLKRLKEKK